jgi:hypothetical protein
MSERIIKLFKTINCLSGFFNMSRFTFFMILNLKLEIIYGGSAPFQYLIRIFADNYSAFAEFSKTGL